MPVLDHPEDAPPYPPPRAQRTIKKEKVDRPGDTASGQQVNVKKEEVDALDTIMGHTGEAYNKRPLEEDTDKELRSSKKDAQLLVQTYNQMRIQTPAPKNAAKRRRASKRPLSPVPRWRRPSPGSEGWNPTPRAPRKKNSLPRSSSPPVPQTTAPEEHAECKRRIREGGFKYPLELQEAEGSLGRHRCRAPSPRPHPELHAAVPAAGPLPPLPPNSPAPGSSLAPAQNNYPRQGDNSIGPSVPAPHRSNYIPGANPYKIPQVYPNYTSENDPNIDMSSSSSSENGENKAPPCPGEQQHHHHGILGSPNYRAYGTVKVPFPPSQTEMQILVERNRERIIREKVEREMERLREANARRLENKKVTALTNVEKEKLMAQRNDETVRKEQAEKLKKEQKALKRGLEYQENCKKERMSKEEQLLKANRDRVEKETVEKKMAKRARLRAVRERAAMAAAAAAEERA